MKKKRVSTTSRKTPAKRVLSAGKKKISASKSKTAKTSSIKKNTKTASKTKTRNPVPRSSRITKALKSVPKIIPAKIKAEIEPLSAAIPRVETITDLPFSYNTTEIVLMARDPHWAFTYWDFSSETWGWIASFWERDTGVRSKLRVHNIDRGTHYDIDVQFEAKSWYLDLGFPESSFEVELGLIDSHGKFHSITRSNRIRTPRSGPSENIDPQWELSEFENRHLYSLAASSRGAAGLSSGIFSSLKRPK